MKSDVDLTENRVFAPHMPEIKIIEPHYSTGGIVNIPYCIVNDIEVFENGGIIQGNKYRRHAIRTEEAGAFCERCGKEARVPWQVYNYLLCDKCEDEVRSTHRAPWKKNAIVGDFLDLTYPYML